MPLTPYEQEIVDEAAQLLEAICRASLMVLTATQQARALAEIEARLAYLRQHWRALGSLD